MLKIVPVRLGVWPYTQPIATDLSRRLYKPVRIILRDPKLIPSDFLYVSLRGFLVCQSYRADIPSRSPTTIPVTGTLNSYHCLLLGVTYLVCHTVPILRIRHFYHTAAVHTSFTHDQDQVGWDLHTLHCWAYVVRPLHTDQDCSRCVLWPVVPQWYPVRQGGGSASVDDGLFWLVPVFLQSDVDLIPVKLGERVPTVVFCIHRLTGSFSGDDGHTDPGHRSAQDLIQPPIDYCGNQDLTGEVVGWRHRHRCGCQWIGLIAPGRQGDQQQHERRSSKVCHSPAAFLGPRHGALLDGADYRLVLARSRPPTAPWGRIRPTIAAREAMVKLERVPRRTARQADLCAGRTSGGLTRAARDGQGTRRAGGVATERAAGGRSAHDARNNGGDRAGQGSGIVAGNRRWRRIRPITAGSSMMAISARRPPHRGQASRSMPKLRRISSAQ